MLCVHAIMPTDSCQTFTNWCEFMICGQLSAWTRGNRNEFYNPVFSFLSFFSVLKQQHICCKMWWLQWNRKHRHQVTRPTIDTCSCFECDFFYISQFSRSNDIIFHFFASKIDFWKTINESKASQASTNWGQCSVVVSVFFWLELNQEYCHYCANTNRSCVLYLDASFDWRKKTPIKSFQQTIRNIFNQCGTKRTPTAAERKKSFYIVFNKIFHTSYNVLYCSVIVLVFQFNLWI